ncbi:methylamine utilization protein MauJ [Lewinella sp. W8]|uniref:methylamine utilization protein MauJ n=1 Tax=Lewinella sp. W8 TaxID=2528208 RepID=UPI00106808E2|nr:methylamine utilization protein MauJ [Lewinella sp. W8]MTB53990.1 hypothetical protein [Lewinella sp. W8]
MKEVVKYTIQPEDWKYCAVVDLGIEGYVETILSFENHGIRIFRPSDLKLSHGHVIEIYSPKKVYDNMESAFDGSTEILQRFLNRVSFITYQDHNRVRPISITRYKVDEGEEFEMLLTLDMSHGIPRPKLESSDFDQLLKDFDNNEVNHALHEMRLALKSESLFEKLLHFYNVIEQYAELKTTEKAKRKCPNCGEVSELEHKATGNKMREAFSNLGFSNKDFKDVRKLRSKIAHGSSSNLIIEDEELHKCLSIVEEVAVNSLSDITEIKIFAAKFPRIIKQRCIVNGVKLQNHTGKESYWRKIAIKLRIPWLQRKTSGPASYDILKMEMGFEGKMIGLDDQGKHDMSWKPLFGPIGGRPEIFPYAWPY